MCSINVFYSCTIVKGFRTDYNIVKFGVFREMKDVEFLSNNVLIFTQL